MRLPEFNLSSFTLRSLRRLSKASEDTNQLIYLARTGLILIAFGGLSLSPIKIVADDRFESQARPGAIGFAFHPDTTHRDLNLTVVVPVDGKFYVGSEHYSYVLQRLNADGTQDESFNSSLDGTYEVRAIAVQSDGKALVAGSFEWLGTGTRQVTRINPDGATDPTFAGLPASGTVRVLDVHPNGKVLIGGQFIKLDGRQIRYLARLNSDGTLDTTFIPSADTNSPDAEVQAIGIDGDKAIVGGNFTQLNGEPASRIVRLNADGSIDNSFKIGAGADGAVRGISREPDGKWMIWGSFATIAGTPRPGLARLLADGSVDLTFDPGQGPQRSHQSNQFESGAITGVAREEAGYVVIGDFQFFADWPVAKSARLSLDGKFDPRWTGLNASSTPTGITSDTNGESLVWGPMRGPDSTSIRLARLKPVEEDVSLPVQQEPSAGWDPVNAPHGRRAVIWQAVTGSGLELNWHLDGEPIADNNLWQGTDSPVLKIRKVTTETSGAYTLHAESEDGSTIEIDRQTIQLEPHILPHPAVRADWVTDPVAGGIVQAVRLPNGGHIVVVADHPKWYLQKITATGEIAPLEEFHSGTGFSGKIEKLIVESDGSLMVQGEFYQALGTNCTGLVRLHPDGSLDQVYPPITDHIYTSLLGLGDGRYLAGTMPNKFRAEPEPILIRFQADGTQDESFSAPSSSHDGIVDLATATGGAFYGVRESRSGNNPEILRFNADGTIDESYASGSEEAGIIEPDGEGGLIVGGPFGAYGRPYLARFTAAGVMDETWGSPLSEGPDSRITQITRLPEGGYIVRGDFNTYDSFNLPRIVRLNSAGVLDTSFPLGTLTDSRELGFITHVSASQGDLYFARGSFLAPFAQPTVSGNPPAISSISAPQRVAPIQDVRLFANVLGDRPIDLQWMLNGTPIPSATGPQLVLPPGDIDRTGNYVLTATNEFGTSSKSVDVSIVPARAFEPTRILDIPNLPGINQSSTAHRATGGWWLGGRFSFSDGSFAALIAVNPDGSIDEETTANPPFKSGTVKTIHTDTDGSLLLIGTFTLKELGAPTAYIVRLNPDGSFADVLWDESDARPSNTTLVTALLPSGNLVANGDFSTFQGDPHENVVVISPTGNAVPFSSPYGDGINWESVTGSLPMPDGGLLVWGPNDQLLPTAEPSRLLRINPEGIWDRSYRPALLTSVKPLTVLDNGDVLISSTTDDPFAYVGGLPVKLGQLAADGTLNSSFFHSDLIGNQAHQLPGGEILVRNGGSFSLLNKSGNLITKGALSGTVYDSLLSDRNTLIAVGNLTDDDSQTIGNIADLVLYTDEQLSLRIHTENESILKAVEGSEVVLSVTVTGGSNLQLQWFHEGVPLPDKNRDRLVIADLKTQQAGNYQLEARDSSGRVMSRITQVEVIPNAGFPGSADFSWQPAPGADDIFELVSTSAGNVFIMHPGFSAFSSRDATGQIRTDFIPSERINGALSVMLPLDDGGLIVAGDSYSLKVDDQPTSLAKYNADGSADASFGANGTAVERISATGGRLLPDGRVLLVREPFYAGVHSQAVFRFHSNGQMDTNFNGIIASISAIEPAADGASWVAGNWQETAQHWPQGLWRLDDEGNPDPSFPGRRLRLDETVDAIAATSDGGVVALFTNRSSGASRHQTIERFKADGSRDGTLNIGHFSGFPITRPVTDIAVDSEDRIIAVGNFSQYDGANHQNILRLLPDGSADPSFGHPGRWAAFEPEQVPDHVQVAENGAIFVWSDDMDRFAGRVTGYNLHRLHGGDMEPGTPPIQLAPAAEWATYGFDQVSLGLPVLAPADANIRWFKDGDEINGATGPRLILPSVGPTEAGEYHAEVTLLAASIATTPVEPPATVFEFTGRASPRMGASRFHGGFSTAARQPDGKILIVSRNGTSTTDHAPGMLIRINPDGTVDDVLPTTFGPLPSSRYNPPLVYATTVDSAGRIYVAGSFTHVNGQARAKLARLLPNGSLDPSWNSGTGASSTVTAIALSPTEDKIVIGGQFTSYNGQSRLRFARLDPDGSLDPEFIPDTSLTTIPWAMDVSDDGKVTFGGVGIGRVASPVRRFNSDGNLDPELNYSTYGQVFDLAYTGDGDLLIASEGSDLYYGFVRISDSGVHRYPRHDRQVTGVLSISMAEDGTIFGATTRGELVRFKQNGVTDLAFGAGAADTGTLGPLYNLEGGPTWLKTFLVDDQLSVIGDFTSVGQSPSNGLLWLNTSGSQQLAWQTTPRDRVVHEGQNLQWSARATSDGSFPIYYQWTRSDEPDTSLGNTSALSITRATMGDAGTYRLTASSGADEIDVFVNISVVPAAEPEVGDARPEFRYVETSSNPRYPRQLSNGTENNWWILENPNALYQIMANGEIAEAADTTELGEIKKIRRGANGQLLVWGRYTDDDNQIYLIRFNSDGTRNSGFTPDLSRFELLNDVRGDAQGRTLVSVQFKSEFAPSGRSQGLLRFLPDGSIDPSFQSERYSNTLTILGPSADGSWFIGGRFSTPTNTPETSLAKFDATGARDLLFSEQVTGTITYLKELPDSRIFISGNLDTQGTSYSKRRIAVLSETGFWDESFQLSLGDSPDIRRVQVRPDGRIVLLVVIDQVTQLIQLRPDGTMDPSFPIRKLREDSSIVYGNTVNAQFELQSNGDIMLLGDFAANNSDVDRDYMALIKGTSLAPEIIVQPHAMAVTASGERVTFGTEVLGAPDLSYQWRLNNTPIPDTNSAILELTAPGLADMGSYDVVISNSYGSTTSEALSLEIQFPPAIIRQPIGATVLEGAPFTFVAEASSEIPATLQWFFQDQIISGATESSLSIGSTQRTDAGNYTLVATNSIGSTTSVPAKLVVNFAPEIISGPEPLTVNRGAAVRLEIMVVGHPQPTFQWFLEGNTLPGETSPFLDLDHAQGSDAGNYSVVVSNHIGSVSSDEAQLSVNDGPEILVAPRHRAAIAGDNIIFRINARGLPPLSYQWFKDGVAISGATDEALRINGATTADIGSYTVKVTDEIDSLTTAPRELNLVEILAGHTAIGPGYRPGQPIRINVRIRYVGNPDIISLSILPPESDASAEWVYLESNDSGASTLPIAQQTDLWEWSWTSPPENSEIELTFLASAPLNTSTEQAFVGTVSKVIGDAVESALAQPDPLVLTPATAFHTADTDGNFRLSLGELLRVIEIYNTRRGTSRTGRYRISAQGTDDGIEPDPETADNFPPAFTQFHNADSDRDAQISLSELLRVIELYNNRSGSTRTGAYRAAPTTTDGFEPEN